MWGESEETNPCCAAMANGACCLRILSLGVGILLLVLELLVLGGRILVL